MAGGTTAGELMTTWILFPPLKDQWLAWPTTSKWFTADPGRSRTALAPAKHLCASALLGLVTGADFRCSPTRPHAGASTSYQFWLDILDKTGARLTGTDSKWAVRLSPTKSSLASRR